MFLCLHFKTSSVLEFSAVCLSSIAMWYFPARQRPQRFEAPLQALAFSQMDHCASKSVPDRFRLHTNLDSSVEFSYRSCLMLVRWLAYRCLNCPSVVLRCLMALLFVVVTVALYTKPAVRQLPSRGHWSSFRQLKVL